MTDEQTIEWFNLRGHWLIRKVPNTKDQYYVAGNVMPPVNILRVYGIV